MALRYCGIQRPAQELRQKVRLIACEMAAEADEADSECAHDQWDEQHEAGVASMYGGASEEYGETCAKRSGADEREDYKPDPQKNPRYGMQVEPALDESAGPERLE